MPALYFVTGTDTDCGKTTVSIGLLNLAHQLGRSTLGIKPIASGGRWEGGQLRNQDALSHLENASIKADYSVINPFCFEPAIAPHIAAENIGQTMTIETLTEGLQPAFKIAADFKLIEGAGGWYVPLNTNETYADWVTTLKLPVIVVVGIKLGAINHALLTLECIHRSHLDVVGWVGNCIDPDMLNMDETIVFLRTHIHAPCLGIVPFLSSPHAEKVAKYLSLPSMS